MLEIPHETCLVNRHHRTEAHRHGRKLPELEAAFGGAGWNVIKVIWRTAL